MAAPGSQFDGGSPAASDVDANATTSGQRPVALSVIIPAWNEAPALPATIDAIQLAAATLDLAVEVIVVDDDSDDDTAVVARAHGARVEHVRRRRIGAVRNAGARIARAGRLLFVDADTLIDATVLEQAWAAMDRGVIGGGALVRFDRAVPLWARGTLWGVMCLSRLGKLASGCFVFCTREAFDATGGFDESLYATEEWAFSRELAKHGRVVIVPAAVVTSARKVDVFGFWRILGAVLGAVIRGPGMRRRAQGMHLWYGRDGRPPREAAAQDVGSPGPSDGTPNATSDEPR